MSIPSSTARTIFKYIVDDFESAWNALVAREGEHRGGANFMFALLSMILLEFACRVCAQDLTGKKLDDLTDALKGIEPRYFTPLPGSCNRSTEFSLPGDNSSGHLLGMIFDLVRNGKAHQYQSAIAHLSDGEVDIDVTGAASKRGLKHRGRRRLKKHLSFKTSPAGDLVLYVRTDQLFLDFKRAIRASKVISEAVTVTAIVRPRSKPKRVDLVKGSPYAFTVAELERNLESNGHKRRDW